MDNTVKTPKEKAPLFSNPLVRKLSKVTETSDVHCTYQGITGKSLYFLLMILAGMLVNLLLIRVSPIEVDAEGEMIVTSMPALIGFGVSGLLFLITPFLAFFIKKTLPVTGTLYCLSAGYFFSGTMSILPEYQGPMGLALVLTLAIVGALALLYGSGKVKVNQKFRTVMTTLMIAMVLGSLLMLVCYFVPGLRDLTTTITQNPLISIGLSAVGVVIASLFLMVDFDTIQKSVENKLPQKYEWYASFSLIFSVVWLYLKVLDLIMAIQNGSKD